MPIYRLGDDSPVLAPTAWVADGASVIGRVTMADDSSVWYGAILRGDLNRIDIGRASNVQDGCILHADADTPLTVGRGATIAHRAVLHACWIGDNTLVGIGAIVLSGARIARNCIVGAGTLVTEGREFAEGTLIVGSPARALRQISPEQEKRVQLSAEHYVQLARRHRDLSTFQPSARGDQCDFASGRQRTDALPDPLSEGLSS